MLKAHEAAFDALTPWLSEARHLQQVGAEAEEPHPSPERRIFRAIYLLNRVTPIRLPWCGLFVAHCLRRGQPGFAPPRRHARARPWLDWGEDCAPQLGAVMVFWHYHRRGPFGHVAFYVAEDDDAFHVLGGNQMNRICVMRYPKTRLLGCRWPEGTRQTGHRLTAPPEHARPFR
jgi:uncharacterized protein (TIGR02594 family)